MKTYHILFGIFLSFILLMLADCTKEIAPAKAALHEAVAAQDNFVSIGQVLDFAAKKHPLTKATGEPDFDVAPYCGSSGDTLLYIVNYGDNDGWQILSSDARTPAVIAEGETGSFSLTDGSPAVQVWLDCTAQDIAAVRRASDSELNFSKDEIAANKQVWGMRGDDEPLPIEVDDGHWEETISLQEIATDSVVHMTPHWSQEAPYNAYCPLTSYSSTERVPAGCVAVAAAEVLYYLHYKLGTPATMVDYGYCTGDIYGFSRSFTGNSSAVWAQMDTLYHTSSYPADAEAIMIGYFGECVGMNYNNYLSYTWPIYIKTQLFPQYGITSSYSSYNVNTIKNSLESQLPVITTASTQPSSMGHCFVIDGYLKTYTRYTHYHYYVPDDPNHWFPSPELEPYYTFTQTTPQIKKIRINWGWGNQWIQNALGEGPFNDGWYSLTADWTVQLDANNTTNYAYDVYIIYNYATTE